jgi:intracellular sulfur oxidation DsrE/DsrF family protein
MKTLINSVIILFVCCSGSFAQKHPYNVIFDMTSHDTTDHKIAIRWINEVLTSEPNANIEIVFYAKSLDMITKGRSVVSDQVMILAKKNNVTFRVCAIAMKNNNVDKSQLLEGVQTVPDGIYEIISKQQDNWGYIKVSH